MKKIAIVGSGPNYHEAPFNDDNWEIWTIAGLFNINPRVTRVYEIHHVKQTEKDINELEPKLAKQKYDWMLKNVNVFHPSFGKTFEGRAIDFEGLMNKYGRYFTSSIAWMLAEAIEEEPDEIALYGVSMSSQNEYSHQKPAVAMLVGWAKAKGIKVLLPRGCELLSAPYIYGYEEMPDWIASLTDKKRLVIKKAGEAEAEVFETKRKFDHWEGYKHCLEDIENGFYGATRTIK